VVATAEDGAGGVAPMRRYPPASSEDGQATESHGRHLSGSRRKYGHIESGHRRMLG
jgi:hypothetical protein